MQRRQRGFHGKAYLAGMQGVSASNGMLDRIQGGTRK
jgi:hypothetical protein